MRACVFVGAVVGRFAVAFAAVAILGGVLVPVASAEAVRDAKSGVLASVPLLVSPGSKERQVHGKGGVPVVADPASGSVPSTELPSEALNPAKVLAPTRLAREGVDEVGFVPGKSVEDAGERSATERVFDNPDGTTTVEVSPVPTSYSDDKGVWREIDSSVVADPSAKGNGRFVSKANSFQVVFEADRVGYSMVMGDEQAGFFPVDAVAAAPVIKDNVVTYVDAWPGVDARYTVTESGVKADFVFIRRPDRHEFLTALEGVNVTGRPEKPSEEHAADLSAGLTFSGPIGKSMLIAPPIVSDEFGANFFAEAGATIDGSGATIVASVDPAWLSSVPESFFPLVLDPTTVYPSTYYYEAYKSNSNGYSCTYPTCAIRVGNSLTGGVDTTYRSVQQIPYPEGTVISASLNWGPPSNLAVNGTGVGVTAAAYWGHGGPTANTTNQMTCTLYSGTPGSCDITPLMQYMDQIGSDTFGYYTGEFPGYYNYAQFVPALTVTLSNAPNVTGLNMVGGTGSVASGFQSHQKSPVLHAAATDPDGDNIVGHLWVNGVADYPNLGPLPSGGTFAVQPTLPWNQPVTFVAQARDGYNLWGASMQTSVTAVNGTPPRPALSAPAPDTVLAQSALTMSSSAVTDPDGDSLVYQFSVASGSDGLTGRVVDSGAIGSPSYSVSSGVLNDGVYYWTVRACDQFSFCSPWAGPRRLRVERRLLQQSVREHMQRHETMPMSRIDSFLSSISSSSSSLLSQCKRNN